MGVPSRSGDPREHNWVLVGRGWGAVTVVLSGIPTAAGNALGVRQGRGKPGLRGSRFIESG